MQPSAIRIRVLTKSWFCYAIKYKKTLKIPGFHWMLSGEMRAQRAIFTHRFVSQAIRSPGILKNNGFSLPTLFCSFRKYYCVGLGVRVGVAVLVGVAVGVGET